MTGKKSSPPHFRELPDAARQCAGPDALALELPAEQGSPLIRRGRFSSVMGKSGRFCANENGTAEVWLSFLAMQGTEAF